MQPYQLSNFSSILRVSDNTYIPLDVNNSDYQAYLAWVSEGNTPDPAPPLPVASVSADAGWVAYVLAQQGLLASVETYVATQSAAIQALWAKITTIQSNNALVMGWAISQYPSNTVAQNQVAIDSILTAANAAQANGG